VSAVAEWDPSTNTASVKQYGQRLVLADFAAFFRAEGDGAKVEDLRKHYEAIRAQYPELAPPGTKAVMVDALRKYESAHPDKLTLTRSDDQFYGFSKGKNLLERHLQWIHVPAVKDASAERLEAKNTALGLILQRTVRSQVNFTKPITTIREEAVKDYRAVLNENEQYLVSLSSSLTSKLQNWAHPEAAVRLAWHADPDKSVSVAEPVAEVITGEGPFEGDLARFGHGLQRSFLLALLQQLAGGNGAKGPTLVLACEEPELYQHPPQIRHLASVFETLASGGAQVMVCTHNPLFVRGGSFEDVRLIRRDPTTNEGTVRGLVFDELAETIAAAGGTRPKRAEAVAVKISQVLQPNINEMFFTSILILVEGLEDLAYLATYLALTTDRWDDFRRLGCHIVPCNGKSNMIQPRAIAKRLEIPTFTIFDADKDKCDTEPRRKQHEDNNRVLLRLCSSATAPAFPDDVLWTDNVVVWPHNLSATLESEIGKGKWDALRLRTKAEHGIADVGDLDKNVAFIGCVLAKAWEDGKRFAVLEKLCAQIIAFAETQRTTKKITSA